MPVSWHCSIVFGTRVLKAIAITVLKAMWE